MLKVKTFPELRKLALALQVDSSFDISHVLSMSGLTRSKCNPASQTTLKHVRSYMAHLSQALPHALHALGNPTHWRAERLLDPATMTLRRPKIYLDAKIKERGALYISWGLFPTVPVVDASHVTARTLREASDFLTTHSTWPFGVGPAYTIVRLTSEEHPARWEYGPADEECFSKEEEVQRETFEAFLASMVTALRAVLDVTILDWVEFDESGRLVELSPEERVVRLAQAQHVDSAEAVVVAAQRYAKVLERAGVAELEFERALLLAEELDTKLQDALLGICRRKANAVQLRACARAKSILGEVQVQEVLCREVLAAASAEF